MVNILRRVTLDVRDLGGRLEGLKSVKDENRNSLSNISVLLSGYSVHLEPGLLEQKEGKFCLQWDRDVTVWYHHTYQLYHLLQS